MTEHQRFDIQYDSRAIKELQKLDGPVRRRIVTAVMALAEDPRPVGVRRLVGYDDLWRLRVGDYRVVYTIRDSELLVLLLRVAHRREVYRLG